MFVSPSERWGDSRVKLLQGTAWDAVRTQVCQTLGRQEKPEHELAVLQQRLQEIYQRTAANLPSNTSVRIEQRAGQDALVLTGLERVVEPTSLRDLREQVSARLPLVDLPEVVLEIERLTGFASAFSHLSEGNARAEELSLSVCAVLIAEACNIGLTPLIDPDIPALTRERLSACGNPQSCERDACRCTCPASTGKDVGRRRSCKCGWVTICCASSVSQ